MIWMKRIGRLPKWMLTVLAWKLTVLACLLVMPGQSRARQPQAGISRASGWTRAVVVAFQRHFMQLLVESAKLFTMSKDVESACFHNVEVVQPHDQGKHVLVAGGH